MKVIAEPARQGVLQRADAFVQRLRDAIDARIRAVLPGDDGAIAAKLVLNLKAAKALGLMIPQTLIVSADEVIGA